MSVNGISGYSQLDAYSAYQTTTKAASETAAANQATKSEDKATEDTGVVYEPSAAAQKYTQNAELVQKLLSEQDSYKNQLLNYVKEALYGQSSAGSVNADNMWSLFADGKVTVSQAAKEEAAKSLEDGGYWSVEKTSDRIIEFAKAISGNDKSKLETLRSAVEEGYKQATKAWGKDLPEISSKTLDAVMKKFDAWAAEE